MGLGQQGKGIVPWLPNHGAVFGLKVVQDIRLYAWLKSQSAGRLWGL
ncbi:hypothetical protein MSP8887_04126 [Marinomonas spartinae]|nr:hypothetical protein [Marinomonas spartinae]SBS40007.1 hypothetical protein MSP8887_04126 [Marinomonas spartinae]